MSKAFDDVQISRAIMDSYHEFYKDCLQSDVLIAGAGPSGLLASYLLAKAGKSVVVVEKKLAPGGGVWGGGMTMSKAVIQEEVLPLLDELEIAHVPYEGPLHVVDTCELASGLCYRAIQAGAKVVNLNTIEDVCLEKGRVTGLVVNKTLISGVLHVDPIVIKAKEIIDGTGHDALCVQLLRQRGLLGDIQPEKPFGEAPMDAHAGELFVVENTGNVCPGLWVMGMSVCATYRGPRMGPIFGGMLLSANKVVEEILPHL